MFDNPLFFHMSKLLKHNGGSSSVTEFSVSFTDKFASLSTSQTILKMFSIDWKGRKRRSSFARYSSASCLEKTSTNTRMINVSYSSSISSKVRLTEQEHTSNFHFTQHSAIRQLKNTNRRNVWTTCAQENENCEYSSKNQGGSSKICVLTEI